MSFLDQIASLSDFFDESFRSRLSEVHVALPCIITEDYDEARNSVTVKPLLNRAIHAPDGGYQGEELPEIYDVPVAWPILGGAAGPRFQITFPIAVGDTVLVVFPDYDIQAWRTSGQRTDPGDCRRHHLAGAIALPCSLLTLAQPMVGFNSSALELGAQTGLRVAITQSQMRVGGNAKQVALADAVRADLLSIKSDLAAIASAAGTTSSYVVSSENALGSDVLKVGS